MSCGRKNKCLSLSARLTKTYALLFCAMTLGLSLCVFFVSYQFLIRRQQTGMMANAEILSDLILREIGEGDDLASDEMLSEFNTNESMSLIISDSKGNLVNQALNFDVFANEMPDCMGKSVLYSQTDGAMLLCHAEALEDETLNAGVLTLVLRMDREYEFLEMLAWLLFGVNLAGIAAALVVGWITTRKMLVPIGGMIEKARSIDSGLVSVRLDVPEADDELRLLALTFNEMLDRVERAFIRQGQFTQDASHELRTPLSVLQGNADLLARWGKDNPEIAEKCVSAIQRQTEYMRRLVEALLFLARGDSGGQVLKTETVDVGALFSEILEERRSIDPLHAYEADAADGRALRADPTLLRQLLSILLDNAAKYTPEGGKIALFAFRAKDGVHLGATDEGVGVPDEQLEHIFERFYRLDKARARATGGMGLGLSIARAIVEMHGGSIRASASESGGLTVAAIFP